VPHFVLRIYATDDLVKILNFLQTVPKDKLFEFNLEDG